MTTTHSSWLARATVIGFGSALAVWVTWLVTHLPWVGLAESVSIPVILGVWLVALVVGCSWTGRRQGVRVGIAAGLIASLLGLLILGSKLMTPSGVHASDGAPTPVPSAPLIALGFVVLGGVLGAIAGAVGASVGSPSAEGNWLGKFAIVSLLCAAPLVFVGGLVTSTNSGMAVPDWPNTYGSNMFLYPLGPRVAPTGDKAYQTVFFEHSHRLFGTLVGLSVLTLTIWVLRRESRKWVWGVACGGLILVILQGVLGGVRVLMGSQDLAIDMKSGRWFAIGHGVLAQVCLGVLAALAVYLTTTYAAPVRQDDVTAEAQRVRKAKIWSTALLHTLILQLAFGALYRHLRSDHALLAHIAFSFVVAIFGMMGGMLLTSVGGRIGAVTSRIGLGLVACVILQVVLGWVALIAGTKSHEAGSVMEAIVRTTHQANGALLLVLAASGFVWARRAYRASQASLGA